MEPTGSPTRVSGLPQMLTLLLSEFDNKLETVQTTVLARIDRLEERVGKLESFVATIQPKSDVIPAAVQALNIIPEATAEENEIELITVKPNNKRARGTAQSNKLVKHNPKPAAACSPSEEEEIELNPTVTQVFAPLRNFGNTCYVNSAIQLLFKLPHFVTLLHTKTDESRYAGKDKKLIQDQKDKDNLFLLKEATQNLHKVYLKGRPNDTELKQVIEALKIVCPEFSNGGQKDVVPVMTYLLNAVGYQINLKETTAATLNKKKEVKTIDLVGSVLSIDIAHQELLKMIESSLISKNTDVNVTCETKSGKRTWNFVKTVTFSEPAPIVFFNLKRTIAAGGAKIKQSVPFQTELNLSNFLFQADVTANYKLAGAIMHLGASMIGGHFCAYLPNANTWYRVSDDAVEPLKELADHINRDSEVSLILAYERA